MMIDEFRQLTTQYHKWLRDKTVLRELDGWVEITCPFLDRHNDYLQIYARPSEGGFLLTDDGYTISDLDISGCKLNTPKRKQLLMITLNGFGVQKVNNELQVSATNQNFARKKHNLLQAMLAVNDLFYLASPITKSLFYEDVVSWLELSGIRHFPNVKLSGKSGFDHHYHFVIPKSDIQPDRVLLSVNDPSRASASNAVFAWLDTSEARERESRAYAMLNDGERAVPPTILEAFQNHNIQPVPWSQRDSVREELAA
ncbi:MAG: DUF1828 domain-containing protein [Chloroflexota bacterium]|nr:DUF1828 domain-containing protein [Chloroflexota bacterium]MDE2910519.1 DUF1828 domain-containing protein [Chloroflexota bacterium]